MYWWLAALCIACLHVFHPVDGITDKSHLERHEAGHRLSNLLDEQLNMVSSLLQRSRRSPTSFGWSYGGGGGQQSRYTARSTRTFSNDEIDAFNQGLHRKRPKFIGKRQALDVSGNRPVPDAATAAANSDCAGSRLGADEDGRASADKRSPPRKFLGRRSWSAPKNVKSYDDDAYDGDVSMLPSGVIEHDDEKRTQTQAVPRRKFVGKRPTNRKFVGKRILSNDVYETATDHENEKSLGVIDDDGSSMEAVKMTNAGDRLIQAANLLVGADQSAPLNAAESKRASRKYVG